MSEWRDFFLILKCLICRGELQVSDNPKDSSRFPSVNAELVCTSCGTSYPVFQDVPIMFAERKRTEILLDAAAYESHLQATEERMRQTTHMAGAELDEFRRDDELTDALSWEILFWERWKRSDKGFVDHDRAKIEEYLASDTEGGGHLRFLDRLMSHCGESRGKRLLNIGAGRDFLLERALEAGCEVVEQDIVLEPLLLLKQRKASFCACCDARALPFEDNAFDLATSFGVLHHIWPVDESFAELLRVTRGLVHCLEPNCFALTRAALLFPKLIRDRLKQWCSVAHSRSPYEHPINPYWFKKLGKQLAGEVMDFYFPKSSWIEEESGGARKALRAVNMALLSLLPFTSAQFGIILKKGS